MIDRLFFPVAFAVFGAVSSFAFASSVFGASAAQLNARADAPQIVQLERVVITGKRVQANAPLARIDAVTPAAQRLQ